MWSLKNKQTHSNFKEKLASPFTAHNISFKNTDSVYSIIVSYDWPVTLKEWLKWAIVKGHYNKEPRLNK